MFSTGFVQVTFLAQLGLVTALLLRAGLRNRRLAATATALPNGSHRPAAHGERAPRPPQAASDAADVARLDEERARLLRELDGLRAAHATEEAEYAARRRQILLDVHAQRRVATALAAAEPELTARVEDLRAVIEHLEHRRAALAAEVDASTSASVELRGRVARLRRDLDHLRSERERVVRRARQDVDRLRDLAHRRELLRAETDEMATLLDVLQQLSEQSTSLSALSDGELDAVQDRPRALPPTTATGVTARPSPVRA